MKAIQEFKIDTQRALQSSVQPTPLSKLWDFSESQLGKLLTDTTFFSTPDLLSSVLEFKRTHLDIKVGTPEGAARLSNARSSIPRDRDPSSSSSSSSRRPTRRVLVELLSEVRRFRLRDLRRRQPVVPLVQKFERRLRQKKLSSKSSQKIALFLKSFQEEYLQDVVELLCQMERVGVSGSVDGAGGEKEEEEQEGEDEDENRLSPAATADLEDFDDEDSESDDDGLEQFETIVRQNRRLPRDEDRRRIVASYRQFRGVIHQKQARRRKKFIGYLKDEHEEVQRSGFAHRENQIVLANQRLRKVENRRMEIISEAKSDYIDRLSHMDSFEESWREMMRRVGEERVQEIVTHHWNDRMEEASSTEKKLRGIVCGEVERLVENFPANFPYVLKDVKTDQGRSGDSSRQPRKTDILDGESDSDPEVETEDSEGSESSLRDLMEGESRGIRMSRRGYFDDDPDPDDPATVDQW